MDGGIVNINSQLRLIKFHSDSHGGKSNSKIKFQNHFLNNCTEGSNDLKHSM